MDERTVIKKHEEISVALSELGATRLANTPFGVIRDCGPDKARALLLLRPSFQRKITRSHANHIRAAHDSGSYVFTGETIKFTSDLNLIDGQHRLTAQADAGVTMDVYVCIVPADAYLVIDTTSKSRSLMQLASLHLEKSVHSTVISALVFEQNDFLPSREPKPEKIKIVAAHEYLEETNRLHKTRTGVKPTSGVLAGAARCLSFAEDKERALRFFEASFNNEHMVDGVFSSAAKALATHVYTRSADTQLGYDYMRDNVARAINAWNAHKRGRDVKSLKGTLGKSIPTPVP